MTAFDPLIYLTLDKMASSYLPGLASGLVSPTTAASSASNNGASIAVGNLTGSNTPFDIPQSAFTSALTHPNATGSFSVPGYNVSAPADVDDGSGNAVAGWTLGISVATGVSLSGSDAGDTGDMTDLMVLSLAPPTAAMAADVDPSWVVCGFVYTGLAATNANNNYTNTTDGSCGQMLPSACIKELVVDTSSQGVAANGSCSGVGVPQSCQGLFAPAVNSTALGESSLGSTG